MRRDLWVVCFAIVLLAVQQSTSLTLTSAPPYESCIDASVDGRFNIPQGDLDYQPSLDPDGNGIACEPYSDFAISSQ